MQIAGSFLRGLMLDAARFVESPAYYRRFLDFCAEWQINAVIFRLTDDQGCALHFRSHPELRTHTNALSPSEVAELARYAAARGIELIPEIESLGHSRYITQTPEHSELNDQGPDGHAEFSALIPLHPKTLQLLGDLYAEAADLFSSRYLHAGCDEVNWGGSAFSRALLIDRTRAQVCGDYLNALHARIHELGKEMIVWDDMVLRHDPTVLDHLDRRIILHDWEYAGIDATVIAARLALAGEKGFRMIGGPALHWCKWGPRVGTAQLRNIDAYADVYFRDVARDPTANGNPIDGSALGVIVCNWCPARTIRDAIWDGLAYAAVAINEGGAAARATAFPRFVERHFGATWNAAWADALVTIYDAAPTRESLPVPWANDDELRRAIEAAPRPAIPFNSFLAKIDALQPCVRRNHADFAALRLSFAYLAQVCRRQAAVRGLQGQALSVALAEVARGDSALATSLAADWREGRAGDPLAELDHAPADWAYGPEDWLHGRFLAAARYAGMRQTR
ncbi:MAG: family 20 glycosylhydrolase [Kiritimatiellae bacterium]|nr:family 20 glycosylhydrolase [Kiritimatiellia bacterium]